MARYEWSEEQKKEIGELVAAHWGCNFQTTMGNEGIPILYAQASSQSKIRMWEIHRNGMVREL